jgi:hypothetical protein
MSPFAPTSRDLLDRGRGSMRGCRTQPEPIGPRAALTAGGPARKGSLPMHSDRISSPADHASAIESAIIHLLLDEDGPPLWSGRDRAGDRRRGDRGAECPFQPSTGWAGSCLRGDELGYPGGLDYGAAGGLKRERSDRAASSALTLIHPPHRVELPSLLRMNPSTARLYLT